MSKQVTVVRPESFDQKFSQFEHHPFTEEQSSLRLFEQTTQVDLILNTVLAQRSGDDVYVVECSSDRVLDLRNKKMASLREVVVQAS